MANKQDIDFSKMPKLYRVMTNVGVTAFILIIVCLLLSIWIQPPIFVKLALTSFVIYGITFGAIRLESGEDGEVNTFGDEEIAAQCLKETNPKKVKELGRKVKGFDADKWSEVSYQIMVDVNIPKWEKLKDKLLATGSRTLVEASPYDKIWGIGMHEDDAGIEDESNWQGMNLLGKALMEVRTKLK